jgi:phage-related protein (TIGR01555 family)
MLDMPKKRVRINAPKARVRINKPAIKITQEMVARSRRKPVEPGLMMNPFTPRLLHPPGVGPKPTKYNQHPTMAMDDAMLSGVGWANTDLSSMIAEGTTFLGYPYLAELALRTEYRRISEIFATEMTRKFIRLKAKGDEGAKAEQISMLNDDIKNFKVKEVMQHVTALDGYFGRAHIYIDTGQLESPKELLTDIGDGRNEVSLKKFKPGSLLGFKAVDPIWCWPTKYNTTDPLADDWYNPTEWYCMSRPMHASRLLTFIGRPVPDIYKPAFSFGGLSRSQMSKPYVDNWLRTRQSVSDMIHSYAVSCIKTDLSAGLKEGGEDLFRRMEFYNNTRDNRGLAVLDMESEDFVVVATPLSGLDKLQVQALEQICASCGIPLVKYTGISPSGLNATSEWEIRVFYDLIHSEQEAMYNDHLHTILGFLQLNRFGQIDDDITYEYVELYEMTELEKSQKRQIDATTGEGLINTGVLHPEEERKRIANDPDTPYEGLDIEDVPELLQPQMGGQPGEPGQEQQGNEQDQGQEMPEGQRMDKEHQRKKELMQQDHKNKLQLENKKQQGQQQLARMKPKGKPVAKDADILAEDKRHFDESKIHRGQPTNKGEFGPGNYNTPEGQQKLRKEQLAAGRMKHMWEGQNVEHPGHGYSKSAKLFQGKIYTTNVDDAVRALYENKKVELHQPREVSTLVDKLAKVTTEMVKLGGKAPDFNLCNVSVAGTNLFCAEAKGIPRIKMPQLTKEQTKAFLKSLQERGIDVDKDEEKPQYMRATQDQIVAAKIKANADKIRLDPSKGQRRVVVSRDNYILDGHHHWGAMIALDAENNKLGDNTMRVARVDMDIVQLLEEADKFTGGAGHKGATAADSFDPEIFLSTDEWREEDHPRVPFGQTGGGQFTKKVGGELGEAGAPQKYREITEEKSDKEPERGSDFSNSEHAKNRGLHSDDVMVALGYTKKTRGPVRALLNNFNGYMPRKDLDSLDLLKNYFPAQGLHYTLEDEIDKLGMELRKTTWNGQSYIGLFPVSDTAMMTRASLKDARTIVEHVLKDIPFDINKVHFETKDRTFKLGDEVMHYAGAAQISGPEKGNITLYLRQLSRDTIAGVTAHEIEHTRFQDWIDKYEAEYQKVINENMNVPGRELMRADTGELKPPYAEKYPIYQQYNKLVSQINPQTFARADGVTNYSKKYWDLWWKGEMSTDRAMHETLAEMARVFYENGRSGPEPGMDVNPKTGFPVHKGPPLGEKKAWEGVTGTDDERFNKMDEEIEKGTKAWHDLFMAVNPGFQSTGALPIENWRGRFTIGPDGHKVEVPEEGDKVQPFTPPQKIVANTGQTVNMYKNPSAKELVAMSEAALKRIGDPDTVKSWAHDEWGEGALRGVMDAAGNLYWIGADQGIHKDLFDNVDMSNLENNPLENVVFNSWKDTGPVISFPLASESESTGLIPTKSQLRRLASQGVKFHITGVEGSKTMDEVRAHKPS